ncbi:hypothetical protein [Lysobacter auxotrophicus]|uniref:Uncharacterized protein n=1 Tax=Lysobacter auxotrophicus TaxID=2992573 RepID=A0ABN6UJP5_9GAMM|nr:hypothetical protein [Lysobacter auxotrophicus]BDU16502.1 hypothetical protein LA521A_17030 [Lysobacter auxotrophicus]
MLRVLLALAIAVAAGCASVKSGPEVVRIDATSVETAEASYQAMMVGRSVAQQQRLALAVLMLNLEGAKSANEVGSDPGSVGPIRNKVAGLSADEIIALAARVKEPRVEAIEFVPAGR